MQCMSNYNAYNKDLNYSRNFSNSNSVNSRRKVQIYDLQSDCYNVTSPTNEINIYLPKRSKTPSDKSKINNSIHNKIPRNTLKKRRNQLKLRAAAALTAIGIAAGTIFSIQNVKNNKSDADKTESCVIYIPQNEVLDNDTTGEQTDLLLEDEQTKNTTQIAIDIMNNNEEIKEIYNNITDSLAVFSRQIGQDGLALIKKRVEEIAGNEVNAFDVLKILHIESNGRIYDSNGNYLQSYTGEAYGPFQLTPETVDYINNYYNLNLDIMNEYDNLDACIYNLKFLTEKKKAELEKTGTLLTGNNIMEAVFWGYHDGAWADEISYNGQQYINKYKALSVIDEYPEVVSYILQGEQ